MPKPSLLRTAAVLAAVLAAGLGAAARLESQAKTPPAQLAPEQWIRDLEEIAVELPKRHKDVFFRLERPEFEAAVAGLKAALPGLTPAQSLAGMLRLVASIGDSHTTLGYRAAAALPLMISWLDDGLWVRNATSDGRALLDGRLTAIDGRSIEEISSALAGLIPHENEAQVRNQLPGLLTDPFVLNGLGLIARPESVRLTAVDASGRESAAELQAVPMTERPAWLVDMAAENAAVLYLKNRAKDYWFEILPESKTLYFQYNACRNMPSQPFAVFAREMFDAAGRAGVERLIVDLRHNGGGNSEVFGPFLAGLDAHPRLNRKGRLFVLIGRRTFSSAILNGIEMKRRTEALFAGEPTGGKPNHYGEVRWFALPASGMSMTYSTKYFREVEGDPATFQPDLPVSVRYADVKSRRDPVLEAVLAYGR